MSDQKVQSRDVFDNAQHPDEESIAGFWRPEHAIPSKPRLIYGDEEKFRQDARGARRRAEAIIHALDKVRYSIVYYWPDAMLDTSVWEVE
jgi:hypothetical protein